MRKFILGLLLTLMTLSVYGQNYQYTINVTIQNDADKKLTLIDASTTPGANFAQTVNAKSTSGSVGSQTGTNAVQISVLYSISNVGTCGYRISWVFKNNTLTDPKYDQFGTDQSICRITTSNVSVIGTTGTADITIQYH